MFFYRPPTTLPANAINGFSNQLLQIFPDADSLFPEELIALSKVLYLTSVFHVPLALTTLLILSPSNTPFDSNRLRDLVVSWNIQAATLSLPQYPYSYLASSSPLLSNLQKLLYRYFSTVDADYSRPIRIFDYRKMQDRFPIYQPKQLLLDVDSITQMAHRVHSPAVRDCFRLFTETLIQIYRPASTLPVKDDHAEKQYGLDCTALSTTITFVLPACNDELLTINDMRTAVAKALIAEILKSPQKSKPDNVLTTKPLDKTVLRRALTLFLTDSLLQTPDFTQYSARIIGNPLRVAKKRTRGDQATSHAAPDAPPPSEHRVVSRQGTTRDVPALAKPAHYVVPFRLPDLLRPEQTLSTPRTEGTSLIGALYYSAEDPKPDFASKAFAPIQHLRNSGITSSISARKNIRSIFDSHRLSTGIIGPYFNYLLPNDAITACYVWICLFTGLNWQFLTELECGNGPCEDNKRLYFDRQTGILTYPMSDGATPFLSEVAGTPSMHAMRLLLPNMIANTFGKVASPRPFQGIDEHAQKKAKYFARQFPVARTPTPERLNATFSSAVGRFGGHLDPHERAWIQGEAPYYLRAQLRYRQIQLHEINKRHQNTVADYTAHLLDVCWEAPNIDWLNPFYSLPTPQGRIGSEVYCEPDVYREFMLAVASKHTALHRLAGRRPDPTHLDTWINLVNIQQLNLYVLAQLCLGLRPIGNTLDVAVADTRHGCLVRDKASAEFTELSHSPLPRILSDQIHACHLGIARFRRYVRAIGARCDLDASDNAKGIAILVQTRSSPPSLEIYSTRMQGSDFESLLRQLDLVGQFRRPVPETNCFRHFLVTELASRLSPPVLSEFLGHQHSGLEYYSPWSAVRGPLLPKIERALDKIINDISPSVLRITL